MHASQPCGTAADSAGMNAWPTVRAKLVPMMNKLLWLIGVVALLYALLCALLAVFQRSFIYFPQPRTPVPDAVMQPLTIDAGEVWASTRPRTGPKALIYFGGNAEDVGLALPQLAQAFPDSALYLLHYRGYGGSAGTPSEVGLVDDALRLFDRIQRDHAEVTVVGRSLGSGVAVQVAAQRPVERLVLVTPYHSVLELARAQFPFVPVGWLLRDRYESWAFAQRVTAPTTVIAAERDEVIPRHSTDALLQAFRPGVATLHVIAGADHNGIGLHPRYWDLLAGR